MTWPNMGRYRYRYPRNRLQVITNARLLIEFSKYESGT